MTPQSLAALRICMALAAYRERYGEGAARLLIAGLEKCISPAHKGTAGLQCLVDGCEKRAFGLHLYCPKHRLRYQRHGDPTITQRRGRKKRE